MVYVAPGEFLMGRRYHAGVHSVTIEKGFYLGKCEVTNGQFKAFVEDTGYEGTAENFLKHLRQGDEAAGAGDDDPVVYVSWEDSKAFCDWAGFRLPTEAE